MTSSEFVLHTMKYWMLPDTGLGLTVVTTAALGLVVSTVIISQTLYAITNDHLGNYATPKGHRVQSLAASGKLY